jgi:hypothetical protein
MIGSSFADSRASCCQMQDLPIEAGVGPGLTIACTLSISPSHEELHHLLSDLLGVSNPRLQMTCNIPSALNLHDPLYVDTFTLAGRLPELRVSPFDGLTFTSLGLAITGFTGFKLGKDGNYISHRLYEYALDGSMEIMIPGMTHVTPATFTVAKFESRCRFDATLQLDILDAFGVKGLQVRATVPHNCDQCE